MTAALGVGLNESFEFLQAAVRAAAERMPAFGGVADAVEGRREVLNRGCESCGIAIARAGLAPEGDDLWPHQPAVPAEATALGVAFVGRPQAGDAVRQAFL